MFNAEIWPKLFKRFRLRRSQPARSSNEAAYCPPIFGGFLHGSEIRRLRPCCEYRKSTGSKQSPSKLWYRAERENKATRKDRSGSSR